MAVVQLQTKTAMKPPIRFRFNSAIIPQPMVSCFTGEFNALTLLKHRGT
jgi:hypothetical protein